GGGANPSAGPSKTSRGPGRSGFRKAGHGGSGRVAWLPTWPVGESTLHGGLSARSGCRGTKGQKENQHAARRKDRCDLRRGWLDRWRRGSGVRSVHPMPDHNLGGIQVAFQAMEALRRNLACELGPHGIRVVTLQTAGIVDSLPEDFEGREAILEATERRTMLKRAATLEDVGN